MTNACKCAKKVAGLAVAAASFVLLLSGASVLRAVPGESSSGPVAAGCPDSGPGCNLESATGGK